MSSSCSNCQQVVSEHANYCAHCGQGTRSHRQPFLPFIKEALHELLDIDGRLSRTLKTLVLKPGLAAYEYDRGMRAKYTPPLRLYLVISVIFFLAFASFHQMYTGNVAFSDSAIELYSRAMFVLFPLFALFVKCFYHQSYFISNLVFSLHMHSVGYLVLLFIAPLEAVEQRHQLFLFLQALPALYFLWYFLQSFKTMYVQSWPMTILKALGVYTVYMGTLGLVFDVVLG